MNCQMQVVVFSYIFNRIDILTKYLYNFMIERWGNKYWTKVIANILIHLIA